MKHLGILILLSFAPLAHAADVHVRVSPDVKTGVESTTEYPTIQMALDHHPDATPGPGGRPGRVFLHIAPGIYHERVIVTQNHPNVTFLGTGKAPSDVVITNSLNAKSAGGTYFTETVRVDAPGFEADNLTFENSAGNTGQAVALALRSDRSVIKHCRILGHQDTLFADFGRQYFLDTYIEGTVDFIFGNATAVFDGSEIHELSPAYLTAQSRTAANQTTGYVILHSKVTSSLDNSGSPTGNSQFFLGRPWRPFSRVVVIETELPSTLSPEGWSKWKGNNNDENAFYAEFRNSGPGASTSGRAHWTHQLTPSEAKQYLPTSFLAGSDHWNPAAEAASLP